MNGEEEILVRYKKDLEAYAKLEALEVQKQLSSPMIHPMNTFRQSNV